jgi:hypothetical protein
VNFDAPFWEQSSAPTKAGLAWLMSRLCARLLKLGVIAAFRLNAPVTRCESYRGTLRTTVLLSAV